MAFIIRPLTETDYSDLLVGWWKDWGWTPPARDFLPDDGKGGIIIYDEEQPVCAGFLYTTNSKVAWVEFVISNKEYIKSEERKEALTLLVDTLTSIAKNTGHKFSYALIKNKSLTSIYESLGYIKGDEYVGEMLKAF